MKIYVVTNGCYSDYHICGVTDKKDEAEKLKNRIDKEDGDNCNIEIYDTDDAQILINQTMYQVNFGTGNIHRQSADCMESYFHDLNKLHKGYDCEYMFVIADSPEKAFKKACDIKAKIKAEKAGL